MKNKKNLLLLLLVVGCIAIVGGVTYAFFNYSKTSTTSSELVTGEVYFNFDNESNGITLTNAFPETVEEARTRTDNVFTFDITGRNTYNKPIYYEIDLTNGEVPSGKVEANRILPEYLRFDLIEDDILVVDNGNYNDLNNVMIWGNTIDEETSSNITKSYSLRMWLDENILISDTNGDAAYTTGAYESLFASVKVRVNGDFDDSNKEVITNNKTFLSLFNIKSLKENNQDISSYLGTEYPIYLYINDAYQLNHIRVSNVATNSSVDSESASGAVIEFSDVVGKYNVNLSNTNVGGWPITAIRTYVNNDIYNAIPENIRKLIIDTEVVSGYGSSDSANFTSTDKLYLLSMHEIYSDVSASDRAYNSTRQLDYYQSVNASRDNKSPAIKNYNGSAFYLWTRTPVPDNNTSFWGIGVDGDWYSYFTNSPDGVSPAFRIAE